MCDRFVTLQAQHEAVYNGPELTIEMEHQIEKEMAPLEAEANDLPHNPHAGRGCFLGSYARGIPLKTARDREP